MRLIFSFSNAKVYHYIFAKGYVCLITPLYSQGLFGYSSTCGKFSVRYLSLITETCAPVSSKTENNLLFNKTLMRHYSPINPVTLCFCFVERLTVYDPLLNNSFCLYSVNVEVFYCPSKIVFGNFYHRNTLIYINYTNILYHLIFYYNYNNYCLWALYYRPLGAQHQ